MSALPVEPDEPDAVAEKSDGEILRELHAMASRLDALVAEARPLIHAASEEVRTKGIMGLVSAMAGGMMGRKS